MMSMSNRSNPRSGFSLAEMLVYLGILSVVIVLVVMGTIQIAQTFSRAKVEQKISLAAETALSRIVHEIRSASDVTVTPDTLTIEAPQNHLIDVQTSPRIMLLDFTNLTPIDVTVPPGGLVFTEVAGGGESRAVRISLTLESRWRDYQVAHTYHATAVLRGSYY